MPRLSALSKELLPHSQHSCSIRSFLYGQSCSAVKLKFLHVGFPAELPISGALQKHGLRQPSAVLCPASHVPPQNKNSPARRFLRRASHFRSITKTRPVPASCRPFIMTNRSLDINLCMAVTAFLHLFKSADVFHPAPRKT